MRRVLRLLPAIALFPSALHAQSLTSVSIAPSSVVGGFSTIGTVKLTAPAPSGGFPVQVSCAHSYIQVPSPVTVPAGKSTFSFTIGTSQVVSSSASTVFFTAGATTLKTSLTVTPFPIQSLTLSPNVVVGSHGSTGTVILSQRAPAGGVVVQLFINKTFAAVPASITIKPSYLSGTFAVKTTLVGSSQIATVTAGTGTTTSQSTPLTVNPPGVQSVVLTGSVLQPGASCSGTATLQNPAPAGGVLVTLSKGPAFASLPSSVTVRAGYKTATFSVTVAHPKQNH